jgi:VWFA-related protein
MQVAGVAALAFLCFGAFGPSQGPPDQPPRPTFRTEANYVRVDVFPTRNGAPVGDLTQEDFEVIESGAPQRIEQFEHVIIRAAGPQDPRVEPNSVAESRSMLEDRRARVFVLFLDTYDVEVEGSHNIREPLVDALDRVIGQDDLVGVMTPEMKASDITFARKRTTIDGVLTRYWTWGQRSRLIRDADPEEQQYGACYPNVTDGRCVDQNGIAAEMIDRRREQRTLDALQDLVRFLRGVREERKAILAITDGWVLFRPNDRLKRQLNCHGVPGPPGIGIDPRSGKLTAKDPDNGLPSAGKCEIDRTTLAQIDDERAFRDLLDEANQANASFYPVDPRGLVGFDTPLLRQDVPGAPAPQVSLHADAAMLASRLTSLRTLAEATDGLAIVNSNDLAGGLGKVVTDLSAYYLLGYYSSGKLDGKFHSITVRVKRPGVQVRARRGYLASTPAATTAAAAARAASAAPAKASAETVALETAIAPLATYARDVPLRLQVAAGWKPADSASAAVWVVGELGGAATVGETWNEGFDATVTLTNPEETTMATGRVSVVRGARTFRIALTPSQPLSAGEYVLRVGARAGPAAIPSRETLRFTIPASDSFGALFLRRGQSTGNRDVPTADLRFRRTEQIRVEIPTVSSDAPSARLLDRAGKPLAVPVAAAMRDDNDGSRWCTAQLALTPLAPGDYVIELSEGIKRTLAAFRVVP